MVIGRICLADGSIAFMRAGSISMVSALAAAVPAVGLDGAAHRLDSQHHPNLLRLAFACAWSSVDTSWLDCAAGIRMRGNGRCNYRVSPTQTIGGSSVLDDGLAAALPKLFMYPESSARHPTHHPFKSLRRMP